MKPKKEDLLFLMNCLLTATLFAIHRFLNGDFIAYNGDFQNYNIFRRLLDGQVQYKDFTNYLGNGIVLINFPFVRLFRSFGASVFITNFTSSILYSLIIFVALYTLLHNRRSAYVITNLIAIIAFILLHTEIKGEFYTNYIHDVLYIVKPGTSMRTTRAFLPFMLVGIFYGIKKVTKQENLLYHMLLSERLLICVYLVLGVLTVWSNDYGYSCVICFFIIMILINVFNGQISLFKRIRRYCIGVFCTVVGALLSIALITHGNVIDYILTNAGITEYQFWYYRNWYGKYLTVADMFSDKKYVILTLFFMIHAIYFLFGVIRHEVNDSRICKLFLHSTCYVASLIYVVGSGEHNYAHVELITYILGIGVVGKIVKKTVIYIWRYLRQYFRQLPLHLKKRISQIFTFFTMNKSAINVLIMLFLYCIAVNLVRTNISYRNREYIEGLGTYSEIGAGLDEYASCFSQGELFSTYAGALETVNNIFQPSGTDYIIHVLGDEQRQGYLDHFLQGDYRYVSTLKNDYTLWEYWSSRANWYFYRELYMFYNPIEETNYSIIWEKSEEKNTIETEIQLTWEYVNESTCRIDVKLPDYMDGAYVDVSVRYNTEWKNNRLEKGGIRKVLCVQDGGERYNGYYTNTCYYLKEQSDDCVIPIYVRNGKGFAYISSYPLSCAKLEGVNISANTVIKAPSYSLHVTNYTDNNRKIAYDGVNQNGKLLKFDNTEFTATALEDADRINSNDESGIVDRVWAEGNYIYVSLRNEISRKKFVYPNKLEVVKKEKTYRTLNYTDDEWIGGISRKEGRILLSEEIDVDGLYAVKTGNVTKKITKTELTEQGYCLFLEDNNGIQIFAYPQEIKMIYQ